MAMDDRRICNFTAEIRAAQERVAEIDAAEWPVQYERACRALHGAISRASLRMGVETVGKGNDHNG